MKFLLRRSLGLFFCIASILLLFSCNEEGPNFKTYTYPTPQVASISPGRGYPNSTVYIRGKNFGLWEQAVTVAFKGDTATVDSCCDSLLVVTVPPTATSGKVSLKVWTHSLDSIAEYNVMALPTIGSVVSNNALGANIAASGDQVTITGTGFGTNISNVSVNFNGTPATILSLSDTRIIVTTPNGYESGSVHVTVNGILLTGTALMNPSAKGDVTIFYMKNYQQPFTRADWVTGEQGSTGLWGRPASWASNSALKNQLNKGGSVYTGGLNFGEDATVGDLCLQAGWGVDSKGNVMNNGKMYQTTSLPAGTYKIEITVKDAAYKSGTNCYFSVAENDSLPDVANITTSSLGYLRNALTTTSNNFEFTLSQTTKISIGFVATMTNQSWVRISAIKLTLE